jgi:hypothetical protein
MRWVMHVHLKGKSYACRTVDGKRPLEYLGIDGRRRSK